MYLRVVIVLVLIQTLAILYLVRENVITQRSLTALHLSVTELTNLPLQAQRATVATQQIEPTTLATAPIAMDAEQLQQLIHEQLRSTLLEFENLAALSEPTTLNQRVIRPPDPEALARAHQRIDDFINSGITSEQQMWEIENELVLLDANDRKTILRRLTKAVNSSDIRITN